MIYTGSTTANHILDEEWFDKATTPACTWWNRPEEDPLSDKLECCCCLLTPPCLFGGVLSYFEVMGHPVPVSSLGFKWPDCFIWNCSYIVYPSKMKGPFRDNCLMYYYLLLSFLMTGWVEGIRRALVLGLVLIAGTAIMQTPSVGPHTELLITNMYITRPTPAIGIIHLHSTICWKAQIHKYWETWKLTIHSALRNNRYERQPTGGFNRIFQLCSLKCTLPQGSLPTPAQNLHQPQEGWLDQIQARDRTQAELPSSSNWLPDRREVVPSDTIEGSIRSYPHWKTQGLHATSHRGDPSHDGRARRPMQAGTRLAQAVDNEWWEQLTDIGSQEKSVEIIRWEHRPQDRQ